MDSGFDKNTFKNFKGADQSDQLPHFFYYLANACAAVIKANL